MDFIRTLAIESWTLYSIGMLLVVARLYVAPTLRAGPLC